MFTAENLSDYLEDLKQIVKIESPTLHKRGIKKVHKFFIKRLVQWKLPVQYAFKTYNKEAGPCLLITNYEPILKEDWLEYDITNTDDKKLDFLMLAHVDTVYKVGTYKKHKFTNHNNMAKAPGIIDDKAGALMGLYALKYLALNNFKFAFLLNSNEEMGSNGNATLIKDLAKISNCCFTLEAAREDGALVDKRLGSAFYKLTFSDTSDIRPTFALKNTAILEMANFIRQLSLFSNSYKHNYVDYTFVKEDIESNSKDITIRLKLRFLEREAKDNLEKIINEYKVNLENKDENIKLDYKMTSYYPELNVNEATKNLKIKIEIVGRRLKLPIKWQTSFGGSDACFAYEANCPTIDGLGPVGGSFHDAEKEYLKVDSVIERGNLLIKIINEITNKE